MNLLFFGNVDECVGGIGGFGVDKLWDGGYDFF